MGLILIILLTSCWCRGCCTLAPSVAVGPIVGLILLAGFGGAAPSHPCGCGPLLGLILFILHVLLLVWGFGVGSTLAPSVAVGHSWGWIGSFCLFFDGFGVLHPRPLCGCGPHRGPDFVHFACFCCWFGGLVGAPPLLPSVVVCPSWG